MCVNRQIGRWFLSLVLVVTGNMAGAESPVLPAPLFRQEYGVTAAGTHLEAWVHPGDLKFEDPRFRVLLIGGLGDATVSPDGVREALSWFYESPAAATYRDRLVISAIANANPDRSSGSGQEIDPRFPLPANSFYASDKNPAAAYLWRWIGMHAPDLVVDLRVAGAAEANETAVVGPEWWHQLAAGLPGRRGEVPADSLTEQLARVPPSDTGTIPAFRWRIPAEMASGEASKQGLFLETLAKQLVLRESLEPSPARRELRSRLARSPRDVAGQLVVHYGHKLPEPAYIPAFAMIGRLKLAERANEGETLRDVERIVAPYLANPAAFPFQAASLQSGHLLFCELAERTSGERRAQYIALARRVADLAFDERGEPRESMPNHLEMSDSLFMGGPILAHVAALTGEEKYREACLRHLRFMRRLCLRPDGIYRHSPLDESAWGRGNGFPALGVALSLSQFPADHPGAGELRSWLRDHLTALLAHQDRTGTWHQVIDHPESYRELTATCMIGFAMSRGIKRGWLDAATFQPAVDRAWYAVRTRVATDGRLVDVCTGTGKQKSLRDYYDRAAILGRDDRGGAMALLFALECE